MDDGKIAWSKLDSTTLASANNTITSTITAKKFLFIMDNHVGRSSLVDNDSFRFNGDSGSNYARRRSATGGADSTVTSATDIEIYADSTHTEFMVSYGINISDQEKLFIIFKNGHTGTGAGTAPSRAEIVAKWANTSSQITTISYNITGGSETFHTDSNQSVIGTD